MITYRSAVVPFSDKLRYAGGRVTAMLPVNQGGRGLHSMETTHKAVYWGAWYNTIAYGLDVEAKAARN